MDANPIVASWQHPLFFSLALWAPCLRAFHGMVERSRRVEELGFDWVSVCSPVSAIRMLAR
jgi:hypothetical protein